jgi:hypothetical protein
MVRHGDAVNSVRFVGGDRLLTASDDGTAAIFACSVCRPMSEILAEARRKDRTYQGDLATGIH